ncbi:MAG: sarcosine oxidase subunit gamma [Burkholderiaceae bacterium]|nr:sarcosine oxidase subunit gamma [Burkholderiaceae bacterium]
MPDRNATGLVVDWQATAAIVNLRGDAGDAAFVDTVQGAVGLALPRAACTTTGDADRRILWAGPDDWFVLAASDAPAALASRLQTRLAGRHHAVVDVSSGYRVLRLAGAGARTLLAQGCPLDLHPRAFMPGQCMGSHFFKASVWLWRPDESDGFELLVRSSFAGYVARLVADACSAPCVRDRSKPAVPG